MSVPAQQLPQELRNKRQLDPTSVFKFECGSRLECYKECCADVNIVLTPADVLGLARKLKISTREFLDKHTITPVTRDLHLPVVMLKMNPGPEKKCPFVSVNGCGVYVARPWACRMYPVGTALPPARAGVKPKPQFFLFEDDFCDGRKQERSWTVEQWQRDQGIVDREELEEGFRDLVGHPWFIGGRQLDPKRLEMFFMACYDLDTFREFVFSSTFLQRFEIDHAIVEELRTNDRALLKFAFRWLRFALFGEPTLTIEEPDEQPQTD